MEKVATTKDCVMQKGSKTGYMLGSTGWSRGKKCQCVTLMEKYPTAEKKSATARNRRICLAVDLRKSFHSANVRMVKLLPSNDRTLDVSVTGIVLPTLSWMRL